MKQSAISLLVVVVAVIVAGVVAAAGADGGARVRDASVIVVAGALAFGIQWIAFVPAYLKQTERFYDAVGSLTFATLVAFALVAASATDPRSWLLSALVWIWAGRLGSFLFRRIRTQGADTRFDHIKPSAARFFVAWTLQGLWAFLTLCAALAAITTVAPAPLGPIDLLGLGIWVAGFAIEVIADWQKSRFRRMNPGRYIDKGLWAWSRHPNYFGEVVIWVGVAVIASSTLRGWQWLTLLSPFFVAFLLLHVSGVPILERRADERWGADEEYLRYKQTTPVLIPWPPRR